MSRQPRGASAPRFPAPSSGAARPIRCGSVGLLFAFSLRFFVSTLIVSQTVASRRSRLCLPGARPSRSFPGAIAAWRVPDGAGSPLRALRRFSASPRECARKLSRAIKMPLPRRTTPIVFRFVFSPQHFSCSDFCRARPLPAHKRAHADSRVSVRAPATVALQK